MAGSSTFSSNSAVCPTTTDSGLFSTSATPAKRCQFLALVQGLLLLDLRLRLFQVRDVNPDGENALDIAVRAQQGNFPRRQSQGAAIASRVTDFLIAGRLALFQDPVAVASRPQVDSSSSWNTFSWFLPTISASRRSQVSKKF